MRGQPRRHRTPPALFLAAVRASAVFQRASTQARQASPGSAPALDLATLCDPGDNALFDPRDRRVYQDMTRPLSDYFMSSSHNTYIGGNQLYGKASVRAIARALRQGVRVVELDCMDGTGRYADSIVVKHRYTPMVPVPMRACLETIREHAFVASTYPIVLTLENHCGSHERQRQQAVILREVLGPLLYVPPASEIPEMFASPESLRGRIVLRHKYKVYDLHNSNASSANSSRASSRAPSPSPTSSVNSTPNASPSSSPSASPVRPLRSIASAAPSAGAIVSTGLARPGAASAAYSRRPTPSLSSTSPVPGKRRHSTSPPFSTISKLRRPVPSQPMPPTISSNRQELAMLLARPSPQEIATGPTRDTETTTILSTKTTSGTPARPTSTSPTPTNVNGTAPLVLPESKDARLAREKAIEIFQAKLGNNRGGGGGGGGAKNGGTGAAMPPAIVSKLQFGKKGRKSKKAIADALSELVVVCNQKVKVKTLTLALQSPYALSCSWTEGKLKRALKSRRKLLKTMAFCRRHLMRVYPGMFRLDSSNFGPQKVWNAGVQMVALNTQTWGKPMALHVAKFQDNGGCGYVLKPEWLRGGSRLAELEREATGGHIGDPEMQPQTIMSVRPVACWVPYQGAAAAAATAATAAAASGTVDSVSQVEKAMDSVTGSGSGTEVGVRLTCGEVSVTENVQTRDGKSRTGDKTDRRGKTLRESNGRDGDVVESTVILTEYRDPETMMSDSSITSSISTVSNMSGSTYTAAEQRGGVFGGGNSNSMTRSSGDGGGLQRSGGSFTSMVGFAGPGEEGILLEAVMHGADPAGLEYRKQRRSSAVSKFYGMAPISEEKGSPSKRAIGANGGGHTSSDRSARDRHAARAQGWDDVDGVERVASVSPVPTTAAVAPGKGNIGGDASSTEAAEYAAWKWDDEGPSMEFNIYERKGPGMELLFCTVVHTDGGRRRRSVAQFSVAVSNMREGLRMVRLRNHQTGAFLQGGVACMLVDVTFRPMQDGDIVPDGPAAESSSACLSVGLGS